MAAIPDAELVREPAGGVTGSDVLRGLVTCNARELTRAQKKLWKFIASTKTGQIGRKKPFTVLKLSEIGVMSLPPAFFDYESVARRLVVLDCSRCRLAALPASLFVTCTALSELAVSFNQLTELPDFSGARLKCLWCQNNQLEAVPDPGTALEVFHCDNNKLATLPALGACTALNQVICSHNRLTSLDALFRNIDGEPCVPGELGIIDCSHNQLTLLPAELGELTRLQELQCSDNRLETIPPELGKCAALWTARIENNPLTALPEVWARADLDLMRVLRRRWKQMTGQRVEAAGRE